MFDMRSGSRALEQTRSLVAWNGISALAATILSPYFFIALSHWQSFTQYHERLNGSNCNSYCGDAVHYSSGRVGWVEVEAEAMGY